MEKIISAQRKFFESHATKEVKLRAEQLTRLNSVLKAIEEQLNRVIYVDFKKYIFENYMSELSLIYSNIDGAIRKTMKRIKRIIGQK